MNKDDIFIDSVQSVRETLAFDHDIEAKTALIRCVMKEEMGMRYRKILPLSIHANTAKNLVCR